MSVEVLIVSPEFPPMRGGVSDHTARLAQELGVNYRVGVLTRPGSAPGEGCEVFSEVTDWHDAAGLLGAIDARCSAGTVVWQYVPHMYGRGGVNSAVPQVMAALLRKGRRQVVIAHEIAAPFSLWPQRFFYAWSHRRQWHRIIHLVDSVGISTEAWVEEWSDRVPSCRKKFHLLPSPSSVPVVPVSANHREQWRMRHGLPPHARVMAYFGALSAAKQFHWVTEAWEKSQVDGIPTALVVLGAKPAWPLPPSLQPWYRPLGYVAPEEVSATLQAADVLTLPFIDGVSERRTSFMTGLSHGCPVATTRGESTGKTLMQAQFFASSAADDRAEFVELVGALLADNRLCEQLGQQGQIAYRNLYDWPVVRTTLDMWLKIGQKFRG